MGQTINPVLTTWHLKRETVKEMQGGTSVSSTYLVPVGQRTAFETAFPLNLGHPVYTASICTEYDIDPTEGEGDQLFTYVLSYEPLAVSFKNGRPPKLAETPDSSDPLSVIYEWVGVQDDKPIEGHPSYATAWTTSKPGVTSFIVGGAIYRKTVAVKSDYVFNVETLTKDVGKRQAPEGLQGQKAAKEYWLRLPNNVRSAGGHYEFVAEWKFAPDEVDGDIYTDA